MLNCRSVAAAATFAAALACADTAVAATLTATSAVPGIGGFSIGFDDTNANGLLDIGEITSFSGFVDYSILFDDVVEITGIAGVSVAGVVPGEVSLGSGFWSFRRDLPTGQVGYSGGTAGNWTYKVNLAAVPLPAGFALLLGGLGALAVAARRRA